MSDSKSQQQPTFWQIVVSVFAAMFGVQTEHNRKRDFANGRPIHYISIGIIFIVLFVLGLMGLVSWVLPNSPT